MNDPHLTSQSRTDSARCGAALARHRPRYHFLPPSGWMNDPNGLIQWEGRYHLFYQYSPEFGDVPPSHRAATLKHWGHAVSDDLVHWEHWPVALTPTPGGPDKDGCYSGCAVDNDGVPTLVYTGVFPQCACIATSTDGLVTWTKHPANPVVAAPPAGLAVPGFRDHSVWSEADGWHQVIGSGIRGVGGTALHYTSPDLIHWSYRGQLLTGDAELTNAMWECPDFFPLGDQHVLMVSAHPGATAVVYCVGPYAAGTYDGVYRGRVDLGTCFYAPQSMHDDGDARAAPQTSIGLCGSGTPQGRRLMWGWLREGRPSAAPAGRRLVGRVVLAARARSRCCGTAAVGAGPGADGAAPPAPHVRLARPQWQSVAHAAGCHRRGSGSGRRVCPQCDGQGRPRCVLLARRRRANADYL